VQRLRPPASGGSAPRWALERAFAEVLSGGRHLELWKVGALTCADGKVLTRLSLWRGRSHDLVAPSSGVHERCQRVRLGGATACRQSCGASPHLAPRATSVAAERPEADVAPSSARVVGGRMTARWSGVARGTQAPISARAPTGDLEVEGRRVSHDVRPAVSKGGVSTWVLVT
jgi:hypothetical protein